MPRVVAAEGPLTLAAFPGSRVALLAFGVDEDSDLFKRGLYGFILWRERLSSGGQRARTVWLVDKRARVHVSWAAGAVGAADESPGQEEDVDDDVGEEPPETALVASPSASSPAARFQPGWEWALRRPIRDFKWGDYNTEPDAKYQYTLFAVGGDPSQPIGRPAGGGGGTGVVDGLEPPVEGPGPHVLARVTVVVATPPLHGCDHDVHFNRGVTGQRFARLFPDAQHQGARSSEQWAWLSRGLEEALVHFIASAEGLGWKIRGALYEAHYVPVMRALADARRRGVDVQLVIDWKIGAWSEDRKVWTQRGPQHMNMWALEEAGLVDAGCLHRRTQPSSAINHNKFFVLVAPGDTVVAVWTGSTNITSGAIFGHANVGHVIRVPAICQKYLAYWERLRYDPKKKDMAVLNEEETPLPAAGDESLGPGGLMESETRVIFSPRLRWASALDFFAQLVLSARQCVAFTAAFGISREMAPALLKRDHIPVYLLLEGEGRRASARDIVQDLRRRQNMCVAVGTHVDTAQAAGGSWLPESLTGLNQHVKYVHTKILLVDPFSDCPIVVSGSANFSRASMESNDENMLIVRGNTDLADKYTGEFFRIFEHMRFRNQCEAAEEAKKQKGAGEGLYCHCGNVAPPRVCQKDGPNKGRRFRACAKPRGEQCGFFLWLDEFEDEAVLEARLLEQWPHNTLVQSLTFGALERKMFYTVGTRAGTSAPSPAQSPTNSDDDVDAVEDELAAVGIVEDFSPSASPSSAADTSATKATDGGGTIASLGGAAGSRASLTGGPLTVASAASAIVDKTESETRQPPPALAPFPADLVLSAIRAAKELLGVDSNSKGGLAVYQEARDALAFAVGALPEQLARTRVLEILEDMDGHFVARSKRSWRPFLISVLQYLGEDPATITKLSRQHRLAIL